MIALVATIAITAAAEKHVCIVGGGIAGASTAHFLTERRTDIRVTVFEQQHVVGGRIATVDLGHGVMAEAGASIIARDNRLMAYFTDLLGLKRVEKGGGASTLGLWDGSAFVFRTTGVSVIDSVKLLIRYGYSLVRMKAYVADLLKRFDKLYPTDIGYDAWLGFPSVRDLLERTEGLYNLTQQRFSVTTEDLFEKPLSRELVSAITRVNYGQDIAQMNSLSGSVALAGSGGGLWAVDGGNVGVVRLLFARSNATVELGTAVLAIDALDSQGYSVRDARGRVSHCDAVVIAAPLELSNISLPHRARKASVGRSFQKTVATFVYGKLNTATFGAHPPHAILTIALVDDVFTSIGTVPGSVNVSGDGCAMFKVFSKAELSEDAIERLFAPGAQVRSKHVWFAYPQFSPPENSPH